MSNRIIESLYRVSGIELTESKKLDSSYYKIAKQQLKSIANIPTSVMREVSSRDREFFDPDKVTISLEGHTKNFGKNLEKLKDSQAEIKNQLKGCDIQFNKWGNIFIVIPKETIEELEEFKQANIKPTQDSISFWATTVFGYRNTAVAYGAKIKAVDGFEFPTAKDIKYIQTKLGERRFHEYSNGRTQYFKTYNALIEFIKTIDNYISADQLPSDQELIDSAYNERYYTH